MLGLLRMTPIGRLARRIRWSLAGNAKDKSLTGQLSIQSAPAVAEVGIPSTWAIRVENHSRRVWSRNGSEAVSVRCQWITRTGKAYGEAILNPLPQDLLPGDWADIPIPVPGPAAVGDFSVCWDLVGGESAPTPTASVSIPVTFPRTTDIDYHHVYRTANLEANSWWVVGAYHTRDEYEKSAQSRREMLIECGLTPDSRVLDIGCGTGQMAMALQDYLSACGAFYGTDIGREGIEFCQRTYRRPNFVFAQGEMTRVPFPTSAAPFDLAIFFSVFTHTHVDESVLLLAEARRLLGPRGAVVADIIVSDLVEREGGHRGQMWVNQEHFVRLADSLGFRATIIGKFPWAADAVRLMIRFDRT